MKLSLSNWVFCNLSLEESMKWVKDLGFSNIEFNPKCIQFEAQELVRRAADLIELYNLKCLSTHCTNFYVEKIEQIKTAICYGEASIDIAAELSSPILVVHSYISRNLDSEFRYHILENIFSKLLDYAENRNIKLALENLSFYSQGFGKDADEINEILDVIGFKQIWITLDYCHSENIGQTFSLLNKLRDRIENVHLSGYQHTALKEKSPALEAFFLELKSLNYKGPLTIELSPRYGVQEILQTKTAIEDTLKGLYFHSR